MWARLGAEERVQEDQGKAQEELGCSARRRWKVRALEDAGSSWVCWTAARREGFAFFECAVALDLLFSLS